MEPRRVLYVGHLDDAAKARIYTFRTAGLEVDSLEATDEALTRAIDARSQIVVVDVSHESSRTRGVAAAFGEGRTTRNLPVVLIGVRPDEMSITRSKVPKARALLVSGAATGEMTAVISRVPLPEPRAAKPKAKRSRAPKAKTRSRAT